MASESDEIKLNPRKCDLIILLDSGKKSQCKTPKNAIVGKCDGCPKVFCTRHRHMDSHNCPGEQFTKEMLHAENGQQLLKERTQVVRI